MVESIRRRLISAFIGFAIIPLILLGIVLAWQSYVVDKNKVMEFQQKLATHAADNVQIFFHEQTEKVLALTRLNYFPEMSHEEQQEKLSRFLSMSQDRSHGIVFEELLLLDGEGKEEVFVSRSRPVKYRTEVDWSKADAFLSPLRKGETVFSPVYFDTKTGEPFINLNIPLYDLRSEAQEGVLIARMKLKFLWDVVADINVSESGVAYLVDRGGRVVIHPNPSIVLKNTHFEPPSVPRIMNGLNGQKAVVVSHRINLGDYPLFFVTDVPALEALRDINRTLIIICTILFFTLLGSLALAFVIVRQVVSPIESLAKTAHEISRGDFSRRAEIKNQDEIGALAVAFNSMTTRLLDSIQAVESEKNFVQETIESLTHPFYVIDVTDYSIKLANTAAQFGPLTGKETCYQLTHQNTQPCGGSDHPCPVQDVLKTKQPVVVEHIHIDDKGDPRIVEVYGYPILDEFGEVRQLIEYNVDITERKHLEEQLRQSQKLEAIGSLASGVAHDFNNLLMIIIGYGELVHANLPEDTQVKKDMKEIMLATEKASSLTQQLLAFSRKQVLEIKVLNLNSIVDDLMKMLNRLIGDDISLKVTRDPGLWNVKVDQGQIDQVLINLAVNARDAMSDGGSLDIETSNMKVNEEYARSHQGIKPGDYVMITITDTGSGMSREVQEKIFEPFFTTKGHGTGLGLATVYGIVKQHGGSIYIYSEEGKGTSFKIYFPATQEEIEKKKITEEMDDLIGHETILVVEDEESILNVVCDILQRLSYHVLKASSGEEAIEISDSWEGKIDLLLTDVVMAGINGRQLSETLVAQRPDMKVIYMSGYPQSNIARRGVLEEGMNFLQKPIRPDKLVQKIRDVIDAKI
ncbi:ATP-binding protein [Thermodesulfobacteriota bacterium]